MPPQRIAGRYEIEQEIGRGGMGVVYRARDTRLGRTVALKMLHPEVAQDAELARRLAIEARAASALNHPGIATVFDYEEHPDGRFIVYEFVAGDSLRKFVPLLSGSKFRLGPLLDIAAQMADAAAAAHERGIIHRDLKPENILLVEGFGQTARIKILDFGLAKVRRPPSVSPAAPDSAETETVHTTPGLQVGTVNYMSPEQVEGEPADARSDIYALGLVLYELASGKNPFLGRSSASTQAKILRDEPPALARPDSRIPAELDRILHKCLRKRPDERYQSARELGVDLSNLRTDSAAHPAAEQPVAPAAKRPDAPISIPRGIGRSLLMAIQAGYLAMYAAFIYAVTMRPFEPGRGPSLLSHDELNMLLPILGFIALAGTPVRLYIFSAVAIDYEDFGRKYRLLWPAVMALDLVWSGAALLLGPRIELLALLCVGGLAYLPLAQRRMVFDAYFPTGGRTSGLQPLPPRSAQHSGGPEHPIS